MADNRGLRAGMKKKRKRIKADVVPEEVQDMNRRLNRIQRLRRRDSLSFLVPMV